MFTPQIWPETPSRLRARAVLVYAVQDPALKERLKAETEEAGGRGAFGVPTFFVGEQMLWGVDKLPWLEALLLGKPLTLPRCG